MKAKLSEKNPSEYNAEEDLENVDLIEIKNENQNTDGESNGSKERLINKEEIKHLLCKKIMISLSTFLIIKVIVYFIMVSLIRNDLNYFYLNFKPISLNFQCEKRVLLCLFILVGVVGLKFLVTSLLCSSKNNHKEIDLLVSNRYGHCLYISNLLFALWMFACFEKESTVKDNLLYMNYFRNGVAPCVAGLSL